MAINTSQIDVEDQVCVQSNVVINGQSYTARIGTVIRERFDTSGFTHHVAFPQTDLPPQWFHPEELEVTTRAKDRRRRNRPRNEDARPNTPRTREGNHLYE